VRHPGARGRIACPAPAARATANVTYARRQVPWQKLGTANGRALADATRPRPRPGRTHPVCMRAGPCLSTPPSPSGSPRQRQGLHRHDLVDLWLSTRLSSIYNHVSAPCEEIMQQLIIHRRTGTAQQLPLLLPGTVPLLCAWSYKATSRSVRHHPLPAHALLAKESNRQDHGTAHHLTHTTRIIYSSFECLVQNGSETPANSTEFTMMVCVYTQLLHRLKKQPGRVVLCH
jgi:hypothetical protein